MTWEGNVWTGPPSKPCGGSNPFPDWPDPLPIGRDAKPPPFPLHTLPPWIADFVEAEAASVQTPLDMPAVFALGALAAASAGQFRVRAWDGYVEASNLYTVVAMPPASIKSPVHRHVTAPIVRLEQELQTAAAPDRARAETRHSIAEKRLRRLEDAAAKATGAEAELAMADAEAAREELESLAVPPLPRFLVDDSTPEQLKTLLCEHRRLAMLSAESALFGNVASQRYSRTPNLEAVLAGHPGDRVEVDRRGRHEVLTDPRLTICIAVQPAVLRAAFANDAARERGLFDRFLYSLPDSNVGERDFSSLPPSVPGPVLAAWDRGLTRIALTARELGDEPLVLPLSADAQALFMAYRADLEPQRRTTGTLASIAGWAGKMDGHALRLAVLLHIADEHAGREVTASALGNAIALMGYFLAHAQIAFDTMGEDETSTDARRVLAWVKTRREPTFTRGAVQVGFKGRLTADALAPILERLVTLGYLRVRQERGKPGRPVEVYDVNPCLL